MVASSSYFMKSPPIQYSDDEAHRRVEEFIEGQEQQSPICLPDVTREKNE
jgi:myo-inositol-1-phosphate synthase